MKSFQQYFDEYLDVCRPNVLAVVGFFTLLFLVIFASFVFSIYLVVRLAIAHYDIAFFVLAFLLARFFLKKLKKEVQKEGKALGLFPVVLMFFAFIIQMVVAFFWKFPQAVSGAVVIVGLMFVYIDMIDEPKK